MKQEFPVPRNVPGLDDDLAVELWKGLFLQQESMQNCLGGAA